MSQRLFEILLAWYCCATCWNNFIVWKNNYPNLFLLTQNTFEKDKKYANYRIHGFWVINKENFNYDMIILSYSSDFGIMTLRQQDKITEATLQTNQMSFYCILYLHNFATNMYNFV